MESILALWNLERYDIVVQISIRGFAYWLGGLQQPPMTGY